MSITGSAVLNPNTHQNPSPAATDSRRPRLARPATVAAVARTWIRRRRALARQILSAHTICMTVLDSYSAETTHTAQAVFTQWADPAGWPRWDPEVREVSFEGPARVGARGTLRPRRGPRVRFAVTAFDLNRMFTNTSSMPGARLVFEHTVLPAAKASLVSVTVRIEGPLAGLWQRVLLRNLGDAARSSVVALLTHLDAR